MRNPVQMYISEAGEYGTASSLVPFELTELTDEQWRNVEALDGGTRYEYVMACLDDDEDAQAALLGEDA
jgi:hypothetical protein